MQSPSRTLLLAALLASLPGAASLCSQAPARPDDKPADFRLLVRAAIEQKARRVVIPPGVYRLAPEKGRQIIWTLAQVHDLDIIADGVTLIGTVLTRAVALEKCRNVTLQGLTVDYDPLPFTQGTVVAIGDDKSCIDVKIHHGYPLQPYSRIDIVDPATRFRKKGMPFLWGAKAAMAAPDTVRISRDGIGRAALVGDFISMSTGPDSAGGVPHAITIDDCAGTTFRDVTVHSAPGMGIIESDGDGGAKYLDCKITRGPRPDGATEDRLLTTSWDAMQSTNIRRGPLVENCIIENAGDDSWSVQSADYLVVKHADNTLTVLSRDPYTAGLQPGDRIRLSNDSPAAVVLASTQVSLSEANLAPDVLDKLKAAPGWSLWAVSRNCSVLTLDHDFSAMPGDSIFSPDRQGAGFIFRNNKLHSSGRVLIKAGNGLIEGNLLDTAHGLVVNPELPAEAATGIRNLVIRNNTIHETGYFCPAPFMSQAGAISITAAAHSPHLRAPGIYDGIVIENNTVTRANGPNLVISSAQNVTISGNHFIDPQQTPPNATGRDFGIPNDCVIWVGDSARVNLTGNKITALGPFARKAVVIDSSAKEVTQSGTVISATNPDAIPPVRSLSK